MAAILVPVVLALGAAVVTPSVAGAQTSSGPAWFVPVRPQTRVLDTRLGIGVRPGPLANGEAVAVPMTGATGIPSHAVAIVFNLTVAEPTAPGYVTAWPSSIARPVVSSINFGTNQTIANLVTVKTGTNGDVSFFHEGGAAHVIADVQGYYTRTQSDAVPGGWYRPADPVRWLDTRSSVPLGPGQSITATIADGTTYAAMVNVTAVEPSAAGYLTVYGAGSGLPTASTLNFAPGRTIANQAVVDSAQAVVYNGSAGTVHVLLDVVGLFQPFGVGTSAPVGWYRFTPVDPFRATDTRGGSPIAVGRRLISTSAGRFGIPNQVAASVVNIVAIDAGTEGFVSLVNADVPSPPRTSTLNVVPGQNVAGGGIGRTSLYSTPVGMLSGVELYNGTGAPLHLLYDVVGYFS